MTKDEILAGLKREKEMHERVRLSRGTWQKRVDGEFKEKLSVTIDGKVYSRKPKGLDSSGPSLAIFYKKYKEIIANVPIEDLSFEDRVNALSEFSTRVTYQHTDGISDDDLKDLWVATRPDYERDVLAFQEKGYSERHALFMAMVMGSARGSFLRDGPGVFDYDGLSDSIEEFVKDLSEEDYKVDPVAVKEVKPEVLGKVQLRFPEGFRDILSSMDMFPKVV